MSVLNRIKSQSGDTIVEVLIATAIVSSVLGISLATVNKNFQISRQTQERTEAIKIAQGQLEILRSQTEEGLAMPSVPFCFRTNLQLVNQPTTILKDNLAAEDFTDYDDGCTRSDVGYYVGIKRIATRTYRVYVRWDKVGGARDEVKMVYRTVQ